MISSETNQPLLTFIKGNPSLSSKEIYNSLNRDFSYSTFKRMLARLVTEGFIISIGAGRGTKYEISKTYDLLFPVALEAYFENEIDERNIRNSFNFSLFEDSLSETLLFTKAESEYLTGLQQQFVENKSSLTEVEYAKELERLAIDLSWKSSQIEGNTYSLLETERLLKEKQTAQGKQKDEAVMLLNHKEAIDFIVANPTYVHPLAIRVVEDIHSILMNHLGLERNIRKRRVGISGTNYRPLDNEYQIREALTEACKLINQKNSVFEKALLALILVSYIQPFNDGNKRTARIISNALLIRNDYCPISFRTVDSIDYKKAMLLFYEQNNVSAMKTIFMEQFEFAVKTYF